MRRIASLLLFALVLPGCGSAQEAELRKGGAEIPTWDGLTAINNQELLKPIAMGAAMGDFASVKQAASNPKFAEALEEFEGQPMPSKFKTPEREAARTEVITHFKALIEGSKSGASDEDLKTHFDAANKALITVSTPKT